VLVAEGQQSALRLMERDNGINYDNRTVPKVVPKRMGSTNPQVLSGGDAAFVPKNII